MHCYLLTDGTFNRAKMSWMPGDLHLDDWYLIASMRMNAKPGFQANHGDCLVCGIFLTSTCDSSTVWHSWTRCFLVSMLSFFTNCPMKWNNSLQRTGLPRIALICFWATIRCIRPGTQRRVDHRIEININENSWNWCRCRTVLPSLSAY